MAATHATYNSTPSGKVKGSDDKTNTCICDALIVIFGK